MIQTPITFVTPIKEDAAQHLRAHLEPIGNNINEQTSVNFNKFDRLHFCTFIILEKENSVQASKPLLVFEANIDGNTESFIAEFVLRDGKFLRDTYQYCEGFDVTWQDWQIINFLRMQSHKTDTYYIGHPGRSRKDILEKEMKLQSEIQNYIDKNRRNLAKKSAKDIHQDIKEHILTLPDFSWLKIPHKKPFVVKYWKWLSRYLFPIIALKISLLLIWVLFYELGGIIGKSIAITSVSVIIMWIMILRRKEKIDQQAEVVWNQEALSTMLEFEDRKLQNHLTSVTYVKPGYIRLITLKIVLWIVNISARLIATQGNLSGIVTIHFARWFILKGQAGEQARLVFFSNYSGSWENYLGEFIDQASSGLSAIWSNTELKPHNGFPDTLLLGIIKQGAKDEQRFKSYARNSQIREVIWFSAYPDLSLKNIGNNLKIRDNLILPKENSEQWLKRF